VPDKLDYHLSEFRRIVTNPTIPRLNWPNFPPFNLATGLAEETVMTKPLPSQKPGRKVTLPQLPSQR
jgi:hypothetical protein